MNNINYLSFGIFWCYKTGGMNIEQELSSIQLVVLLYTSNCNRNMPRRAVHATIYNIATTTCYSV